jgi:hypothetical protein
MRITAVLRLAALLLLPALFLYGQFAARPSKPEKGDIQVSRFVSHGFAENLGAANWNVPSSFEAKQVPRLPIQRGGMGQDRLPGGPYQHKVLSASSKDGLIWTRDAGVRLEHASVPCAVTVEDRIFLYYVDADRGPGQFESVGCATSSDGLKFEKQPFIIDGLPSPKAVDPSVVRDKDGRFRLYYFASSAMGDPAAEMQDHDIQLALSDDGIHFRDAGTAFKYPGLVDPDVFFYHDTWFMYVFGGRGTLITTSGDGRKFTYRQILDLPGWGTVAPIQLDDGRLRLYAFDQRKPAGNSVRSFISPNGIDWTAEPGDRLAAGNNEQITDPFVVRWKDGYKMYFKVEDRSAAREPGSGLQPQGNPGPWDYDLLVHRVYPDGRVERLATLARGGVPTLCRMKDGRLIAAHQHFPEDDEADFDKVAVRFSSDEGRTWTPAQVIQLAGLPEGMRFPFDPTLVPLPDGRIRLYFTSTHGRRLEEDIPAIYSAISADEIRYTFEPGIRFGIAGRPVIDCAVVLHQGVYHLFSPDNGVRPRPGQQQGNPLPATPSAAGVGYHATSKDGLDFAREEDVHIADGRRWLGNAQSDGQTIRFFGTTDPARMNALSPGQPISGIWVASSSDGQSWTLHDPLPVPGVDPGVTAAREGGWIVISTGPPRPGTPSAQRSGAAPIAGRGQGMPGPIPTGVAGGDGPWNHRVLLATSKDGLNWKIGRELLAEQASVPELFMGPEGSPILLFVDASGRTDPGALGALSMQKDGSWVRRQTNLRGADPNVVQLSAHTYRAYTKERDGSIQVFSSNDGLDWRHLGEAFRDGRYPQATDPDVFETPSGWVMLVSLGPRLLRCSSQDGLKFQAGEMIDIGGSVSDTVAVKGGWRTFFHVNANPRTGGKMVIRSAFTADGRTWRVEAGDRVKAPDAGPARLGAADPAPLRLANGTWLMALKSFIR